MKWIRAIVCWAALLSVCAVATARAEGPATFSVSEFTFKRPAGWRWVEPSSSMRKAQLEVGDAKAGAEVVFFYFGPGNGGGTKANVDRWFGQFVEPRDKINARSEEIAVSGRKVTYVQAEGTFKSGMPGGPQTPIPGHALAGAIIEADTGSVFVKMTGPEAVVKVSVADLKRMVEGALKP